MGKAKLTPGHPLNAFSEFRPGRTLDLVKAVSRVSCLSQGDFAAFGKRTAANDDAKFNNIVYYNRG